MYRQDLISQGTTPAKQRYPNAGIVSRYLVPILLLSLFSAATQAEKRGFVTAQPSFHEQRLTSFTRARTELLLATELSGRITEITADVGDVIPANGHLLCLDDTFTRLDLEKAGSDKAKLAIDIDYFRKQVNRYQRLVTQNSSAQIQLDESQRNLESVRQQLKGVGIQQQILRERLKRHCIAAPAGWRMISRLAEPGQWINAGEPAAKVGDYSRLQLPFALTYQELQALMASTDIELYLPDSGIRLPAMIEKISPAFDEASRKTQVTLTVDNNPHQRQGGIRAELILRLPLPSGAIILPRQALKTAYEAYWVERADGTEIKVEYLGEQAAPNGDAAPWVQLISDQIKSGEQFRLREE